MNVMNIIITVNVIKMAWYGKYEEEESDLDKIRKILNKDKEEELSRTQTYYKDWT